MPRERQRVTLFCEPGSSKTKQSFRDDADINVIVNRWIKNAEVPDATRIGTFGDFSQATTFQAALERIDDAERMFAALPSAVRKRFDNDPNQLLTFVNDENNAEEARDLGLAEPLVPNPVEELVEGITAALTPPTTAVPGEGGITGGE